MPRSGWIVFICPSERGINEKDRSLCVLGVLSEAGGNSLKLKLTIYDVFYFMLSLVTFILSRKKGLEPLTLSWYFIAKSLSDTAIERNAQSDVICYKLLAI